MALRLRSKLVANKQRKGTPAGAAKRAGAAARKAVEKGKNLAKNKALRRTIDDLLVNPGALTAIPGMSMASKVYKQGSSMAKRVKDSRKGPNVSLCISKWYSCLTQPFSPISTGACIPTGGNYASARNFGYLRFDATIGSSGVGFVAIAPVPHSNGPCIYYTDALFAGTSSQVLTGNNTLSVGVNVLIVPNNKYTVAQLTTPTLANPAAISRLVGGGIRCQYTGTNLNMSGLIYVYTSPSHNSAVDDPGTGGPFNIGSLGAYQECIIKPGAREPQEFSLPPHNESELDYPVNVSTLGATYPWSQSNQINGFTYSSGGVTSGCPTTLIMFTGTPKMTYHFEYGMHVESVGPLTEGQRLPADSDPVGVDTMMAAISNATISVASSRVDFCDALKVEYSKAVSMRAPKARL